MIASESVALEALGYNSNVTDIQPGEIQLLQHLIKQISSRRSNHNLKIRLHETATRGIFNDTMYFRIRLFRQAGFNHRQYIRLQISFSDG